MKIKAVVFDVGGVLCEWTVVVKKFAVEAGVNLDQFMAAFLDLSFNPVDGSDLGLMTADEFFIKLAKRFHRPELADKWRQEFIPGFTRIEPTYKLLDELKGKYQLAALTNAKIDLWAEWTAGELERYFPVIIDSSVEHVVKPDERIYKILLDRLKLKPQDCLFIDDFAEYIATAKKLGFKTVHFTDPEKSVKEIKKILGIE